jgi:hypothetical protein
MNFTETEIHVLCWMFDVPPTPIPHELLEFYLREFYLLEFGRIVHPCGDFLAVREDSYEVRVNNVTTTFHRELPGFYLALQVLTEQVS